MTHTLILTDEEARHALRAARGACPFPGCLTRPVVTWLAEDSTPSWRADGCEHLVVRSGQDCDPDEVFADPRSWQGPGWPWDGGWPVIRG